MPRDQVEEFQELARGFAAPRPARPALSIGNQRLLMLADFLETKIAARNFNMEGWSFEDHECGTVACAAGWAATIPSFISAGYTCETLGPAFEGQTGFAALRRFFDIPRAVDLFYLDWNADSTPAEVAERFRSYISSRRSEV